MLEGDSVFFKCLQHSAAKTDLSIHHIFFDIDRAEALLAGDTGDHIFGFLTGAAYDPGTGILRLIGVTDIDGNTLLTYREDGVLMQDAGSHIGQLTKLTVGDDFDNFRIINNSGISDQEA